MMQKSKSAPLLALQGLNATSAAKLSSTSIAPLRVRSYNLSFIKAPSGNISNQIRVCRANQTTKQTTEGPCLSVRDGSHGCLGKLRTAPIGILSYTQRCEQSALLPASLQSIRTFSSAENSRFLWNTARGQEPVADPRLADPEVLGKTIEDDYAVIREKYQAPKNPLVLCHGLLGFDELRLAGNLIPGIAYWRGIGEALTALGVEVVTTAVPASGSIEVRAKALMKQIEAKAAGRSVNLIGGIDCRYMISQLKPDKFKVVSLTTIATPHRGSSFADFVLEFIGKERLPTLYHIMERIGLQTGAFAQLTTGYMENTFGPMCPNVDGVKYYSYGAVARPSIFSMFRQPHRIIEKKEGPNDGLVSVHSAKHGQYKGTLIGPTHLDIINWTNRLKWMIMERRFNAIAFYCDIADMLAKEGL